jgi:hypothetical protein
MATNVKKIFSSTELTGYAVHLFRSSEAWLDDVPNHVVGAFSVNQYGFTYDIDDTNIWDPTVIYKIVKSSDGGTTETIIQDNLMLADIKTATDLETHIADTTTHGSATALVGVDETQTLTAKVINAPDNTIQNLDGSNHKADTSGNEHPAMMVKPGSDDTVFHIVTSTTTVLSIQAANAAKSANRIFRFIAGSIDIQDKDGNDIVITGLAAATLTKEAVRFDEFDALNTRVTNLEGGGTFTGSPVVSGSVTIQRQIRGVNRIVSTRLRLGFEMDVTNQGNPTRWEIFSGESQPNVSVGSITAAELDYLRDNYNRILIRSGEGNAFDFETVSDLYFVFVAVDDSNVKYSSDPVFSNIWGQGQIPPDRDDLGDELVQYETLSNPSYQAGTADDAVAAEFSAADFKQSDVTPIVKKRIMYKHRTGYQTLIITCAIKIDADTGYVKGSLTTRGGSEVSGKNATGSTTNASYEDVVLEIDVSSGLTVGTRYELEILIWNSDPTPGSLTFLEDAVSLEIVKNIEVY